MKKPNPLLRATAPCHFATRNCCGRADVLLVFIDPANRLVKDKNREEFVVPEANLV